VVAAGVGAERSGTRHIPAEPNLPRPVLPDLAESA